MVWFIRKSEDNVHSIVERIKERGKVTDADTQPVEVQNAIVV